MSRLAAKKDKHFVELKTFEVYDPSGTYVLLDENKVPFTVEMYAPQTKRMLDYDKQTAQHTFQQSARTNGASERNINLQMKRGAARLSHAIKSWHPVSPDGEFLEEYANLSEDKRAELFIPSGEDGLDISWLTDQIRDFFSKGNFVVMTSGTTDAPKLTETAS